MSKQELSQWLMSHHSTSKSTTAQNGNRHFDYQKDTQVIAIASGKGGVGKTTVSLMLSRKLVENGSKVLLIDCDYNLSNTAVKLGLPLNDNFYSLLSFEKSFDECIYKEGRLHLLSGCNGNTDIFDSSFEHDKFIVDIINEHKSDYDYVILDCPAGISRETVNLAAYADYRFMIVNPDKSSLTDTYALIKILSQKYTITSNHLIVNKVSNTKQYQRVVRSMIDTVSSFLNGSTKVLGAIKALELPVDDFDKNFRSPENNSLDKFLSQIVNRFSEENSNRDYFSVNRQQTKSEGLVATATI